MATAQELFAAAQAHHHAGRLSEAQTLYEEILRSDPRHADALHLLGTVMAQQGRAEQAIAFLHEAIKLQPDCAPYHNNLGVIYQDLSQFDRAKQHFENARKADPAFTDPLYNLAKLYRQMDQPEAAMFSYLRVIEIDPGRVDAMINLGNLFFDMGKLDDAIETFERAARVEPQSDFSAQAYLNLGNTHRRRGDEAAAIQAYGRSLAREAHDGLKIKSALTLPVVLRSWAHIHDARRRFEERVQALQGENLKIEDPALETSTTTFFLAYHGLGDRGLQEQVAALHLAACPGLAMVAPHCENPKPSGDKIKLGLVSAYFRLHLIGRLMRGIVAHLDRDQFEVTVFTQPGQNDDVAAFINARADNLVTLPTGLDEARDRIAAAAQDILFYADIGMDVRTYFLAFARLAPVQCVTWGHPDTTGIANLDYFLSSELLEPPASDDAYSEQLYRLKTLPTCYAPPEIPARPKSRDDLGLPAGETIYFCPQSAIKHHPDMDELVGAVLRGDGAGQFHFLEGAVADWTRQLEARMAATIPDVIDRVHVIPRVSPEDFLSLLGAADVVLDTPHFSGGNTSYEAFAMGTPIVAHAGEFMRGRVTTGQYKMMEIDDLIADDIGGMAAIAIGLGTDPGYREDAGSRIAERREALFNELKAVRELERFFAWAWDRATA